jgi:hypothetical protein
MTATPTPDNGPQTATDGPVGRPWLEMTAADFGRAQRHVQTSLFPDADDCGTVDLLDAVDDPAPADPAADAEPCDNCDADDRTVCGCCPACDTMKAERCVACGKCRCDLHDQCTRPEPAPTVDPPANAPAAIRAAAQALAARHTAAVLNEYGSCITAGYAIGPGTDDRARVHHQQPSIDLTDPFRPSSNERAADQDVCVDAYAHTLEAAGLTVERKTVSTGPILLAAPPEAAAAAAAPTAYVAYAYSKRQGPNSRGRYHAVLDQALEVGRYRRDAGDTMCPKRSGFWGLDERSEMSAPTCPGCLDAVQRYGVIIRTTPLRVAT